MRKQMYVIGGVALVTVFAGGLVAASASAGTATYEAESAGNTLTGGARVVGCRRCSGGSRVSAVGASGKLTFNSVASKRTGSTKIQVTYTSTEDRIVQVSVNGGVPTAVEFPGTRGAGRPGTLRIVLALRAGDNALAFSNPSGAAPDIDKIVITTDGPPPTVAPAGPASGQPGVTATASQPAGAVPGGRAASPTGKPESTPENKNASSGAGGNLALEADVVSLVNAERAKAGCKNVTVDARLTGAARSHAAEMAARDYLSHTTSDGVDFAARITRAGYKFSVAAENIAKGRPTAQDVMSSWMNSPGHKANIVNCAYRDIGVGVAADKTGTLLWVQDFATPL